MTRYQMKLYEKAFCYKKMGDYENACNMFEETIARLYKDGYDVEAKMLEEDAREVLLFRKKSKQVLTIKLGVFKIVFRRNSKYYFSFVIIDVRKK